MNSRLMFTLTAIVTALFGVGFMVMPEFVFNQFKTETYVGMLLLARFFGGALLMTAVLYWFGKDIPEASTQKGLAFTSLGGSVAGFAMTLYGIAGSGAVIRANGWILLVVFGFFVMAYAYVLFLQPQSTESKPRSSRKSKTV